MTMKAIFSLLIATGFAYGQFSGLAVTDDGEQVYFTTSLRLKTEIGQKLPSTPAVYRAIRGSVERFTAVAPFDYIRPVSYGNAQTSGDGEVVSFTRTDMCVGGSSCYSHPTTYYSTLLIRGQPDPITLCGNAQISRNGRYVLNDGTFSYWKPIAFHELHDLQTGSNASLPVRASSLRQSVTSDGRVLGFDLKDFRLAVWSSKDLRVLTTSEPPVSAIISDNGAWVVYVAPDNAGGMNIHSLELSSGREVFLLNSPKQYQYPPMTPSISNDGTAVLYLAVPQPGQPRQVWLVRPDGTGRRQLTSLAESVTEAVLAGSGKRAVAATASGRLIGTDVTTGVVEERIGKTPVYYTAASLAPGSAYAIQGSTMLAEASVAAPIPLPTEFGGIRVLIDRIAMPIVSVAPDTVWYQVPFELAPAESATFDIENQSVFSTAGQVRISERAALLITHFGDLILAHQDFRSLVSRDSPALPREIVHAWAAGLGVVMPRPETGVPTPLNRSYPLAEPLECHVLSRPNPAVDAEVLFAGLAPGMIGVYQIDVRMPESFASSSPSLSCGGDAAWFNALSK